MSDVAYDNDHYKNTHILLELFVLRFSSIAFPFYQFTSHFNRDFYSAHSCVQSHQNNSLNRVTGKKKLDNASELLFQKRKKENEIVSPVDSV